MWYFALFTTIFVVPPVIQPDAKQRATTSLNIKNKYTVLIDNRRRKKREMRLL